IRQYPGVLPAAATQLTESSTTADTGSPIRLGAIVAASSDDVQTASVSAVVCASADCSASSAMTPAATAQRPWTLFSKLISLRPPDSTQRKPPARARVHASEKSAAPLPTVFRALYRQHAHAVVGRYAAGIARHDDMIADS